MDTSFLLAGFYYLFLVSTAIWLLTLASRFVRAHERIADALVRSHREGTQINPPTPPPMSP
jgi:hypothetical protein